MRRHADVVLQSTNKDHVGSYDTRHLFDRRLSSNAVRILSIMLARGNGWKFNETELLSFIPVTRPTLVKAMRELVAYQYVERYKQDDCRGYWYIVYPIPKPQYLAEEGLTEKDIEKYKEDYNDCPPTPDEGYKDDLYELREDVIGYLNHRAQKKYRPHSAAVKKNIRRWADDGYTKQDFLNVIENKSREWSGCPKMDKYLRPQTLFGPKFERYVNESMDYEIEWPVKKPDLSEYSESDLIF